MPNKDLIFVLGSGRSGTSAVTGVLSLCACSLPQSVFGATALNPTDHWEPVDETNINVDFITQHGLADDPSMRLDDVPITSDPKSHSLDKTQTFLSRQTDHPALGVKEFLINELFEFWLETARRTACSVKALIAVRHPQEVFESLIKSFSASKEVRTTTERRWSIEGFNVYWLKVNLLAEHHARTLPRVFVQYSTGPSNRLGILGRDLSRVPHEFARVPHLHGGNSTYFQ